MGHLHPVYETVENKSELSIEYLFISKGKRQVNKMIRYTHIDTQNGRRVFNFGFGDYDILSRHITDNISTGNGDVYAVFHTVLSSIPLFFKTHPDALLLVKGSDSGYTYENNCRRNCRKNCDENCRNVNRRISIYRNYIDKNLKFLKTDYSIYGGFTNPDGKINAELYIPKSNYDTILLHKHSITL